MLGVFLGKDDFVGRYLPVDAKAVVENRDASFGLWSIEVVALVLADGGLAEDGKAVGKATGDEDLTVVGITELYSHMLAVGGAALADVHCHIEDGAFDATHELALGKGWCLEVEATKDAIGGHAFVVLHKVYGSHFFVELLLREALVGTDTIFLYHLRFDDDYAFYVCWGDLHKYMVNVIILFSDPETSSG